jgi:hypothetical protein
MFLDISGELLLTYVNVSQERLTKIKDEQSKRSLLLRLPFLNYSLIFESGSGWVVSRVIK